MLSNTYYPQFFSATIIQWKAFFKEGKYKDIIIESLNFFTTTRNVLSLIKHPLWADETGNIASTPSPGTSAVSLKQHNHWQKASVILELK